MSWSLPIGSVLGIRLRLHVTLLVLLLLLGVAQWSQAGVASALVTLAQSSSFFVVILLHELGHAVAALRYNVRTTSITLLPIGGVATMASIPEQPWKEFVIAIAGPMVNLVIAAIVGLWLRYWPTWHELANLSYVPGTFGEFLQVMNIRLLLFNLLPGFPMDGGRILRAGLAALMDYARATTIAVWLGRMVAIGFVFQGLKSPLLPVIGAFIFIAAGNENRLVSLRARLRGRTALDLMAPLRVVLDPRQRLADVIELSARMPPQDFAVMVDGQVVGLLPEEAWSEAIRHRFDNPRIAELMQTRFVCIHGFTQLTRLFQDQKMINQTCFPVLDGERPIGMVSRSALVRAATAPRPEPASTPPPPPPRSRLTIDLG